MRHRRKVSRRRSKKLFRKTARPHKRNRIAGLARGGVRL